MQTRKKQSVNDDDPNRVAEEIAEVLAKIQLLEGDRKAFAESSHYTVRANDAKIGSLRLENRDLLKSYKKCITCDDDTLNIVFPGHDVGKQQFVGKRPDITINGLNNKKCDQVKKLNLAQYQTRVKEKELVEKIERMKSIHAFAERMSKAYMDPKSQKTKNRAILTEIEKYKLKNTEADEVQNIFSKLTRRLKEENKMYESNLEMLENAIFENEDDLKGLKDMNKDAEHSKELAKQDLQMQEGQINKDKTQREKRKSEIKRVSDFRQKELERLNSFVKDQDDPKESEYYDGITIAQQEEKQAKADNAERKITQVEKSTQKVKDATGLNSPADAIRYFKEQFATKDNLESQIDQNAEQIADLERKKQLLKESYDDVKYNGEVDEGTHKESDSFYAESSHREDYYDEYEEELDEVRMSVAQNKLNDARQTLTDLKIALDHVLGKLSFLKSLKRPRPSLWEQKQEQEYLVDVADICIDKIKLLVAQIGEDTDTREVMREIDESDFGHVVQNKMSSANARVSTRGMKNSNQFEEDEDEIIESEEEDIVTRNQVKRASKALIDSKMHRGGNRKASMKFR
ncbi:outer dynein arm-docking complex subunit 3-like [Symsagittifera roscoffensis]|uniref:outer dynein arm-docking complex subunit 3-like n=1 Tax=Symsagittifera roscoffensis TaxID=84072 RepID=UPI00307B5520